MTSQASSQRAALLPSWTGLNRLRDALADRLVQRRRYRTTLSELDALSDRDLADLGLFRCDVRALAHAAVYGDGR